MQAKNDIPPVTMVKQLITSNLPDFAGEKIRHFSSGWDNDLFTLGENFLIRLPRHQKAAVCLLHECEWLHVLRPRLPIGLPVPVFIGKASDRFSYPWSVVHKLPGEPAMAGKISRTQGRRLLEVIRILHCQPAQNAPENKYRGVPLAAKDVSVELKFRELLPDIPWLSVLLEIWKTCRDTPASHQTVLLHGDLHPGNILAEGSQISGLIDWGDITSGDPASDLSVIFMLFRKRGLINELFDMYGADENLKLRAMGWAIHYGVSFIHAGKDRQTTEFLLGLDILNFVARYPGNGNLLL